MTYASPIQTSVNSGELSPRMQARVDFERFKNGAARARNVVLLPTGGFTKAPGTRYIGAAKDEAKAGRVLPFVFSQTDSYVVELSENVMRFYRRQARITAPNISASITNGTFAANINDWDDISTAGAATYSAGMLKLLASGNGYAAAQQDVATTTTGVEHVLKFKTIGDLGVKAKVRVGSATGLDDLFEETSLGLGWHTIAFTPSSSPFYVQFKNDTSGPYEPVYIDDVELLDNVSVELTHDYSEADIADITYSQTADVLYIYHPTTATRRLERRGNRSWSLVTVPWIDGPYDDSNDGFEVKLRQLVKNPDFAVGIEPWVTINAGTTGKVVWDSPQKIVVLGPAYGSPYDSAIENAVLTGVSATETFVFHFHVIGETNGTSGGMYMSIGTTSSGVNLLAATKYVAGWHSVTFTSSASTIYIKFWYQGGNGNSALSGAYLYRTNARLMTLSATGETDGSVTCTASGFSPFKTTDVGRILRLTWPGKEPAWGVITGYTSSTVVTLRLRHKAPYASIPTEDWQFGTWCEEKGYPQVASFFQSRSVLGRTELAPQTLWFSQTGDLENFRPDSTVSGVQVTEDDDALTYLIASEQINAICWLAGKRKLLIGTTGGEYVAESQGAAITATDVSITQHADVFCSLKRPVVTDSAVVFIEGTGRQVHDLGYQLDQDAFVSADMTLLADHMLRSPAQEIVMQKRPLQTIHARRLDGRLGVLSYNRRQDIVGWSHRIMGGAFGSGDPVIESICTIPGSDDATQVLESGERDEVWMIVKRTVNGATHRYIEMQEGYYVAPVREDYATEALWETAVKASMADAFYVDSGVTYSGAATATITGLSHLEGQTVSVLADGKVHASRVVASGSITLGYTASKVQAGLPYTWEFETLRLPFGTQAGSGVTKVKSIPAVGLALLDAGAFTFRTASYDEEEGRVEASGQTIDFLRDGLNADEAIPLFTGEVLRNLDGATRRDVRVMLEGSDPLPFTCLAIVPQILSQER